MTALLRAALVGARLYIPRPVQELGGWLLYGLALSMLVVFLPPTLFVEGEAKFLLLIGLIGAWRYSVGIVHFIRSQLFLRIVFPRLRRAADAVPEDQLPQHVYFLVTSFRIDARTTYQVYHSVFMEAMRCGRPASIVASIVEKADEYLIKRVYQDTVVAAGATIDLMFVRIPGTGKRDGLAYGFRAISRNRRYHESVVAVVDGDTVLEPGVVKRSLPFFTILPNMGALTTNEYCDVLGGAVMRDWHQLRFAQRHINMCSMGLSQRVLTLTGRMSIFRGSVVTDPLFIDDVQNDHLEHWRLGRFRFLTGDDKSSWYSIMKLGYDTFYVPDVSIRTLEHPPEKTFLHSSYKLMFRWYGNSLRQNHRATRLGMRHLGLFTYYVLWDQRFSMWTSLVGIVTALLASLFYGYEVIIAYLLWVGFTRAIITASLLAGEHPVRPSFPVLLYYNQIAGSLVKTWVNFRLDRQSWTRQKTTLQAASDSRARFNAWSSRAMTFSAVSLFLAFCLVLAHGS